MKLFKTIVGTVIAVISLPVVLLIYIIGAVYYKLCDLCSDLKEFWSSIADPSYIPPTVYRPGNLMVRYGRCKAAAEKAAEGDWASAVSWWKKAASLYDIPSMLKLGECYENGRGVAVDYIAAYRYYLLAAQHGLPEGDAACRRLRESQRISRLRAFWTEFWG